MRVWLVGIALGAVLAVVTTEISLIAMVIGVVAVVLLGLTVPPRYALLSGGLIGVGGVWLAGTASFLNCPDSTAACGNPVPWLGVASAMILAGLVAGIATARGSSRGFLRSR
jgi:hypothetical protein